MKHPHASHALKLAILAALTFSTGANTVYAQIVEIREKEASSCFDGRTGDNPDPRSTCPDEKSGSSTAISTMLIRPGQRARMTMQQRSFAACTESHLISMTYPTRHTGWNFSYLDAPCQWDRDRTDLPAPNAPFPNGELVGKQLCAIWRVRNPTAKELTVTWYTARLDDPRWSLNTARTIRIRNNIDGVIETGIAETQRIETCLNPEEVSGIYSHRRWPSLNGLHIEAVPPFPETIRATNGNSYSATSWSYWVTASGNEQTSPFDRKAAATVAFYTDTMRDWALQSGETAGRYYVHLERAWIKERVTGTVVQELQ